MRLLLDTRAFIWADAEPDRLSSRAATACSDASNEVWLSVASLWEMQIKLMLGKLTLRQPLRKLIEDWRQRNGLRIVEVRLDHVLQLDTTPVIHKDPFDRLLVAQAIVEGFTIVTHDSEIARYAVPILW